MVIRGSVLTAALVLGACGGGGDTPARAPETTGAATETPAATGPAADCIETVDVTAVDNEFEPICVIASSGAELTVTNDGALPHTFTIDGTDVDEVLDPGEEATAAVPEELEVGAEHEFHCRFHATMVGYLYVAEA